MIPGQVIVPAAVVGLGLLAVMAAGLIAVVAWAAACWWRDRQHDVGPDALRLLRELDKHLDNYAARDPDVQAGLDRLRTAVRNEQQEGGKA